MEGLLTLFNKFFIHDTDFLMVTLSKDFNIIEIDSLVSSKTAFVKTPIAASIISNRMEYSLEIWLVIGEKRRSLTRKCFSLATYFGKT
uniref:Uncharacterized protein n=1 Tax=Romanomermis culicivorax TaxID=13658 RepID=A0A915HYK2_ROMCU